MIPANLVYNGKVESSPARRFKTNIQPQSGTTFNAGNTITINIPTQANTFLIPSESYLKFQLNATIGGTNSTTSFFDSQGAHSLIQRIRVYHSSSLLQDIDNYGDLAKILFDYQAALDTTQGRLSITTGTNASYGGATADDVKPINRGAAWGTLVASGTRTVGTYCLNLISLVGSLAANKYLPLTACQAAPIRVEIVLQQEVNMLGAIDANVTGFNVTNVEYIAEFLQMSSAAIDAINQRAGGSLQMVVPDWRNYSNSFAVSNNVTISMPVAAKFSSLKSIVVSSRMSTPSTSTGTDGYYAYSHVKNGLSQWTMRIGSEVLPSTAPNTDAEFFSEAAKCFGSLADMNYQPSIDLDAFKVEPQAAVATNTTNSGSFLIALDTETYQAVSKEGIFAGLDTSTSDIFVNMVYGTVISAGSMNYNAFACFDNVIVFENGVAYSRT